MDNYFHWLILALVLATTQTGNAQDIGLRLEEPAQMNARLPELYRVYITNNTAESQSCYVLLRVQEADDGVIGIIRSAPFEVPPGGKTLNAGNFSQLEPLEVQQANPDYESFVLRTNTLPPGSYNICMTLFLETTGEAIAKDCYKAENESFTPPYLLAPQNETVINEEQPFFNWSPASPAPASGSFNYMLLITEMQQGQSPVAAIKSNRPWFLRKNITTPVFQYPAAARPLQSGSRYAWQVIALSSGNTAGKSEVWSFMYKQPGFAPEDTSEEEESEEEEQVSVIPPEYHDLSQHPDGGFRLLNKPVVRFTYKHRHGEGPVKVQLLDKNGDIVAPNLLKERQKNGINFNKIELSNTGVKREELYRLKLINSKNEVYVMDFKVRELEVDAEDLQNINIQDLNN